MKNPLIENPSLTPALYNIGVVTRVTGVPITTLHAWERRYGFPNAERTAGGHRLYSEKDIARLRWVKSQVDMGLTVSRAVIAVRAAEADGRLYVGVEPEPISKAESGTLSSHSIRVTLLDSLTHHDLLRADQFMGEMLAFFSPEELTLNIIGPVLNSIGEAWENGEISIATEHLASNYLRHRLLMWMVTGTTPRSGNPVLLACAPGELHEGSLLMLGVLLRRQGWPVAYLGQNAPLEDLATFINDIHPRAVVFVAMSKKPAKELSKWPQWIRQVNGNPPVTFGGRAFIRHPDLQGSVPGVFLGETIQEGLTTLISIIQPGN
jgi:hypothetical protein